MGLIPQAKCSRCDRIYSGLRTRCPYCGARRRKKGKRVEDTDNAVWKLVIGALLLVVLITAIVVLLINTFSEAEAPVGTDDPNLSGNEGVSSVVGDSEEPGEGDQPAGSAEPEEPEETEEPEEPVVVNRAEKITIMYGNEEKTDFTMKVTENVQLRCVTVPVEVDSTPLWESSNPDVFVVLQSGLVTATGVGTATLVVTCDGVSAQCTVRVKAAS